MTRRHISRQLFWPLVIGAIAGTLLAAPLSAFWLNELQLTLLLATFYARCDLGPDTGSKNTQHT